MKSAAFALMVGMLAAAVVAAPTYTGSLSWSGDGITGTPGSAWLADGTVLEWAVTANGNGTFTYWYQLTVADDPEVSHLTIEVSPTFTANNILDVLQGTLADNQPEWADPANENANPGLPSALWAIKFEDDASLAYTVEFVSDRVPVWGDFYAKGGQDVGIWNAGFTADDPHAAPANGSLQGHLLVPDTTVIIPVPGALGLAVLGFGLVASRRR
ncbi:MAG TPA: hypothetical protein ENN87_15185 [Phycisphaerales bacterium]|nr:hypothetical protein [Phycisphaerales bacterium]